MAKASAHNAPAKPSKKCFAIARGYWVRKIR